MPVAGLHDRRDVTAIQFYLALGFRSKAVTFKTYSHDTDKIIILRLMNSESISAFVRRRKSWLVVEESLDFFYYRTESSDVIQS